MVGHFVMIVMTDHFCHRNSTTSRSWENKGSFSSDVNYTYFFPYILENVGKGSQELKVNWMNQPLRHVIY